MNVAGTIYLYVFDTMADWEIGYVTAELNSGRYYRNWYQLNTTHKAEHFYELMKSIQ